MASTYGYITVANLEAYHVLTYDSVDARYTDAVVEAKISHAEKIVRTLTNTTTATDGAVSLVLELSKYLMNMQIKEDHPEIAVPDFSTELLDRMFGSLNVLEMVSYSPTGSVPMQGIDR